MLGISLHIQGYIAAMESSYVQTEQDGAVTAETKRERNGAVRFGKQKVARYKIIGLVFYGKAVFGVFAAIVFVFNLRKRFALC